MEYPNERNFCSGRFDDWLEVMLTPECDGKCSWCIEKKGWHPEHRASCREIADAIISSGKKVAMLLGGEPTLYEDIKELISRLNAAGIQVYMTSNGSFMRRRSLVWYKKLLGLTGLNLSIHSSDMGANYGITGILHKESILNIYIQAFRRAGITVRLNCNLIRGYVDSKIEIVRYIIFAKRIGADSIRFAELKDANNQFVDLSELFDKGQFGINSDPFRLGCNQDAVICGVPVNFRQMCGFQTTLRPRPENPAPQAEKAVLYYDGKIYDGWQNKVGKVTKSLTEIVEEVKNGTISVERATRILEAGRTIKSH